MSVPCLLRAKLPVFASAQSDDTDASQTCPLRIIEAKDFLQHLVCMLAERRRRTPIGDGIGRAADRIANQPNDSVGGASIRHLDQHAAMTHLRIGEHLGDIIDWPAWHAGGLQRGKPFRHRLGAGQAFQEGHQFIAIEHSLGIGREARISGQIRRTGQFDKSPELSVIADYKDEVAVVRRKYLVWRDVRMGIAEPPGRGTGDEIVESLVGEPRDLRIQ